MIFAKVDFRQKNFDVAGIMEICEMSKDPMILYRDDRFVAVHKPLGVLTHRSSIAPHDAQYLLQMVRNRVGQAVFPVHRLDRKTSGINLFALDKEAHREMQKLFMAQKVSKVYLAAVRGHFPERLICHRPLKDTKGEEREAETFFEVIDRSTLKLPTKRYPESRYSLILAFPATGRYHQIRRHLNGLNHPVICDRPHGCSEQNRLLLEHCGMGRMLLHAISLSVTHPMIAGEKIDVFCPPDVGFNADLKTLRLSYSESDIRERYAAYLARTSM